ncbi:carbohydrate sulfotransferase 9-like isoform X1 [Aquarana catesbeiana]|uniref:carbohydrate sulfotransferase 9-like isoform X1 n=1 Tax=Aquarana catesbeiana TaxID=8400 RepID=UPI003CC994B1
MLRRTSKMLWFIALFSILLLGLFITYLMTFTSLLTVSGHQYNTEMWITQRNRKITLKSVCLQNNLTHPSTTADLIVAKQLFIEENHKLIYCEVPKVGCSNWKRILFLLKLNLTINAEYIEHEAVHKDTFFKKLSDYPPDQQRTILNTYTKVMFTRDPLQRIVSAYRDKFLHYTGFYYGTKIANIIKSKFRGHTNSTESVSFQEFVNFIVEQKPEGLDKHWRPMHYLCDPCNIDYNVLGKFETLKQDSDHVLQIVGAPSNLRYPEIKKYIESRTDAKLSAEYFSQLPLNLLQQLLELYKLDFILFGYS